MRSPGPANRCTWEGCLVFELTGLDSREWLTIAVLLTAVMVAIRGAFPVGPARRRLPVLPTATAVVLVAVLVVGALLRPVLLSRVLNPVPILVTFGMAVAIFAFVDLLFGRVLRLILIVLERVGIPAPAAMRTALAVILVPVVVASGGLVWRMSWGRADVVREAASTVAAIETYELSGSPLDLAMIDDTSGFASFGQGSIVRFDLPEANGRLETRTVADDLEYPRGLAIVGDRLFVAELAALPCAPAFPLCKGGQLATDLEDGERIILGSARGRITSFAIGADDSLSDRRTLLDGLPVADTEHAVNDLEGGPDGRLYVSIGWPNFMRFAAIDATLTPHPEWMGSVLAVDPASGAVEVHARGLRNVYGLAFDDRGGLWGVDNDGPARNGWRTEELLRLDAGTDHGFPDDGTFGPWSRRTSGPSWTFDAIGSAGLAWAGDAALPPGIFTGSCGRIDYLALPDRAGRFGVTNDEGQKPEVQEVAAVDGCVSSIAGVVPGTLVLSVFGYERGSILRIRFAAGDE